MPAWFYDVKAFKAKGDGKANDTGAVQQAIDSCSKAGGGTVVFPSGVFLTGTVHLRSNVTVHLTAGATWRGYPDASLYEAIQSPVPSRMDHQPWTAFIFALDAQNITIEGAGTIHPNGEHEEFQTGNGNDPARPYGIHLIRCRNVAIRDVYLTNSALWMVRLFDCESVRVSGIRIWNHCNLNNDGVDIDGCRNVVVSDCFIDSSDDALCFKSEGEPMCEDIVVTNCILSSHASAFKLGTGSIGGFRRVTATGCVVRPSTSDEMIHPLEAWGGLVGIDLGNVDGGFMEEIVVSDFVIDGVESPVWIRLGERHSRGIKDTVWENAPPATHGHTRGVLISNVRATHAGPIASGITGIPGHPVEDVTLRTVRICADRPGNPEDLTREVPENTERYPINRMFGCNLPAYGLFVRHARGLTLDGVEFECADGEPRPALVQEDVVS
jgi:polygalacturonase